MNRNKFVAPSLFIALCCASRARADAVLDPPHPHTGTSVVTWLSPTHAGGDAHDIGIHQHQHRTNHNPAAGVYVEGGNGGVPGSGYAAYVATPPEWVWDGRVLDSSGNLTFDGTNPLPAGYSAHGTLPAEWAHGHQGDSPDGTNAQPPARYLVQPAVANVADCAMPGICPAEAAAWNANAATLAFNAFNGINGNPGWLNVGNASAAANWPTSDNTKVPGTGVSWHSGVNWVLVGSGAHELNIVLGNPGAGNKAITKATDPNYPLAGHYAAGSAAMTVTFNQDQDWFYGVDPNPANFPTKDDLQTTMLHEIGHVLGLGHFGTYDRGYIMADRDIAGSTGRPNRAGLGGINYVIDPDAIHGIRDLYAIASSVPEPTSVLLMATALLAGLRYRPRR